MSWTAPLILVADPDAAALAVYEELLRSVGYATVACQTARETQQCIEMERPDLLLINLDLDWYQAGWDLLCWVRQEPATKVLPVIMCAADRQWLRVRQRQLQAWQCQVLEQPFSTGQLLTTVQAALALTPHAAGQSGRRRRDSLVALGSGSPVLLKGAVRHWKRSCCAAVAE